MIDYADESYYKNVYLAGRKAVITEGFAYYARSATAKIKLYTGSNINDDNIPNEVKNCCCEVAECLCRDELAFGHNGISSESVGGWSKSYESSDVRKTASDKVIHDVVYKWLSDTGLLFRGLA